MLISFRRTPVYCSFSTNNTTRYFTFFVFSCFYAYFRLSYVKLGLGLPSGLGKMFSYDPDGLEPPAVARIKKKRKIKIRGGG